MDFAEVHHGSAKDLKYPKCCADGRSLAIQAQPHKVPFFVSTTSVRRTYFRDARETFLMEVPFQQSGGTL